MTKINTINIEKCNNCSSKLFKQIGNSKDFEYATCDNEFTYVKCLDCGLVYLKNRPVAEALNIIYATTYRPHRFNEVLGPLVGRIRDRVQKGKINTIKKYAPENAFIVDVGCGSGELLHLIKRYGNPTWQLCGVDFSDEAINALRKLQIRGIVARFEKMLWQDPPPDVIIMNQVIEHLDDPYAVIEKAYAILKQGGHLIVETPSIEGWDAKWFATRYWGGWHTPRHWTLYSKRTLSSVFKRNGFEIAETQYLLSPTFWLQSLHHYVSEKMGWSWLAAKLDTSFLPSLCLSTGFDFFQLIFNRKTSNFRMVGRKPFYE